MDQISTLPLASLTPDDLEQTHNEKVRAAMRERLDRAYTPEQHARAMDRLMRDINETKNGGDE